MENNRSTLLALKYIKEAEDALYILIESDLDTDLESDDQQSIKDIKFDLEMLMSSILEHVQSL
jgi:hypothetical protein